jgi:hypothetical protein
LNPINYAAWKFWIDILVLIVVAANAVYTWLSNRDKITNKRFIILEERTTKLETRSPECQYHPQFEHRLDKMNAGLSKIDGRLDGINRAVDLINEFLINQGGKK